MPSLGLSAFFHDSAAAISDDSGCLAAISAERLNGKKHSGDFPLSSIDLCLNISKLSKEDIKSVGFYWHPLLGLDKRLVSALIALSGKKLGNSCQKKWIILNNIRKFKHLSGFLTVPFLLRKYFGRNLLFHYYSHHLCHLASAFYPSSFRKSAIISIDGAGEWDTAVIAYGDEKGIKIVERQELPHSLGHFYLAFTRYLGFQVLEGEGKVMGLAPYGDKERFQKEMESFLKIHKDGCYFIGDGYISKDKYGLPCLGPKAKRIFPGPRGPKEPLKQIHMDLAAALQDRLNKAGVAYCKRARFLTKNDNLCLAGGVALNSPMNSEIMEKSGFVGLFIQPAAGDDGCALGASLLATREKKGNIFSSPVWWSKSQLENEKKGNIFSSPVWWSKSQLENEKKGNSKAPKERDKPINPHFSPFLGPQYRDDQIRSYIFLRCAELEKREISFEKVPDICDITAQALSQGLTVAWFQGRMEFGPRALGSRSLLGDPRRKGIRDLINFQIKKREWFRPLAPSVLEDKAQQWFHINCPSPYMLLTAKARDITREKAPEIVHVDGTSRIQTVGGKINPLYHRLIQLFHEKTGLPMILNTSLNAPGKPIVCHPGLALDLFISFKIDCLAMGNWWLYKRSSR